MRVWLCTLAALITAAGPARASDKLGPLVRPLGKAVVDWQEGVVTARAGAAADLRLPGVDASRVGAVRAARGKAAAVLQSALAKLPMGAGRKTAPGHIDAALERVQVIEPQYQSNGGVVLAVGVRFDDLGAPPVSGARCHRCQIRCKSGATSGAVAVAKPPAPPQLVLSIASMPLEVAPTVLARGKPYRLAAAVYRIGRPPRDAAALPVRRDRKGRLVLSGTRAGPTELEGARALIYVRAPAGR